MTLWCICGQRRLIYYAPQHSRTRKYYADCILFGFDGLLKISTADNNQVIECQMAIISAGKTLYIEVEGDSFGLLFLGYLGLDFDQAK